ncbi:eukaryotic translation initiation factor 2D-like [Pollicipes pollicipes]|uniref:eukaryotic translation initiation factor 2D-like n=1 Tax=Pollicipes pollicipes TaxID=41117 RepID=UPI0018859458|nr:eukaryotic translation initiation factor 2D-like [Pollicipes pollicipes]XP_037086496.1 eukaryotic translation initiation factor 2D-like [Pollicipes pollicipes]XP_037086498.1 eukaryotic translation initiation factor 2D-like [Pollicipes pollicipes]
MFLKPFRVKSNSQIKGSDRKKLRSQLAAAFPVLTAEACAELIPTKDEVSVSRLVTHGGATVVCYLSAREPVLLELDGRLLPTVYTLWRYPDLLPTFTTFAPVLTKLRGGADLMLPGVIVDRELGLRAFGRLQKGVPVAVNTDANRAPAAVGWAARSSEDMYMAAGRGKAVLLVHVLGDLLWELGSRRPAPELGPPPALAAAGDVAAAEAAEGDAEDGEDTDGSEGEPGEEQQEQADRDGEVAGEAEERTDADSETARLIAEALRLEDSDAAPPAEPAPEPPKPVNMDELLYDAFRQAWRTSAKRLELPVLVSNFYAQHMQPNSPHPLDVKKSSYKKISKFLERMQKEGLVEVKELAKGVQSIVSVALEHPEIRSYKVQDICREEEPAPAEPEPAGHRSKTIERIEELYIVSGNVSAVFKELKIAKGTPMSAQDVRKHLTQYVKTKQLQDEDNKSQVRLDPVLASSLTGRADGALAALRWDELHQRCLQRMSPGHLVLFRGEPPLVKKGAVPSVELNTATRSGNKKITMVLNLPAFGIDPAEFAHRCQVGVAASTSVGEAPNRPPGTSQVMVQGNQIRFIGKLLQEDYKVPKKYIKGLEKAPKK